MADEKKESKIKVEDLPEAEKELSAEEAKNVEGGFSLNFSKIENVKAGDGSVKPQDTSLNIAGHEMTHGLTE